VAKNINARIAAEISWARTSDRSARTRPARETFLKRFEREVDPGGDVHPRNVPAARIMPSAHTCSASARNLGPRSSLPTDS
jgi:hypothetical protein